MRGFLSITSITRLCLESLVDLSEKKGVFDSALDLGCGTGILGMAAARLGIKNVVAVDENNLAVQVARANIVRNGAGKQVRVLQMDLTVACPPTKTVDLVMANLFHDLLASLFNNPDFWQAQYYIISGFFAAREEELLTCLPLEHLTMLNRTIREKWGCWVMTRKE